MNEMYCYYVNIFMYNFHYRILNETEASLSSLLTPVMYTYIILGHMSSVSCAKSRL